MTSPGIDSFVKELVDSHPVLQPLYTEHLEANDELLAYVFFGDITRVYEALCDAEPQSAKRLVADIDAGLTRGDGDIKNLIGVSFLETLGHQKDRTAWRLLTPRLKAGFDSIHGYAPNS